MLLGGIVCDGTMVTCAAGDESGNMIDEDQANLIHPEATAERIHQFFKKFQINALGLSMQGDEELIAVDEYKKYATRHESPLLKRLLIERMEKLEMPFRCVRNADSAALGEFYYGAAQKSTGCLYIAMNHHIDISLIENNHLSQGVLSPEIEMGHILLRRHHDDRFKSICPYHHNCFNGLASLPALQRRCGGSNMESFASHDHLAEKFEVEYISQTLMQYILNLSPEMIILSGKLFKKLTMVQPIQKRLSELLKNYDFLTKKYIGNRSIMLSKLGDKAAIKGTLALAALTVNAKNHADFYNQ